MAQRDDRVAGGIQRTWPHGCTANRAATSSAHAGAVLIRAWLALLAGLLLVICRPAIAQVPAAATTGRVGEACTTAQPIAQARRIVSRAGVVLEDRVVALPDQLPARWRNEQVALRYVVDSSPCTGTTSAAISLYRVGAPYQIRADGVTLVSLLARNRFEPARVPGVARPDTAATPPVFNGRIPNLFALPATATHVTVDLLTLPYIPSGLIQLHLGPTNALMPLAVLAAENMVDLADAGAGVILVLALLAGMLWLHRRHDRGFLWMSLACLFWSVRALAYYDRNVLLPPLWFEQLNAYNILLTAIALCAATLAVPMGRPASRPDAAWRRRPHQALGFALASGTLAVLLSVLLDGGSMLARAYVQLWALGLSLATIRWIWLGRIVLRPLYRYAAVAAYAGLIACAVHDMALVFGTIDPSGPSYLFWGFIVVLVVYALIGGDYIVWTLNRAENSNLELEQHIASKSAELEDSFQQLRRTEMAGALTAARQQERERLLRDMHDGMGAQLMTALRGAEREALDRDQIAQCLQGAMDELRMLMDSADMGTHLSSALADWRNRWDSRLGAAGVQLHWHLDDAIDTLQLDSDTLLQVMRILQEAATNVVKHARARNLHVQARLLEQSAQTWLVIVARDDGCGMPDQDTLRSQRGLRNMAHRAKQIGARLEISNASAPHGGCQVMLELRIQPPPKRPERRRLPRSNPAAGTTTVS